MLPVTSSNTQYKKGRKKYNIFNQEIASGNAVIDRSAENLALIMLVLKKDFETYIKTAEQILIEENKKGFAEGKKETKITDGVAVQKKSLKKRTLPLDFLRNIQKKISNSQYSYLLLAFLRPFYQ